jgi:hypothetical protein
VASSAKQSWDAIRILFVFLFLLNAGGCALVDQKVHLDFQPLAQERVGEGEVLIARPPEPALDRKGQVVVIGTVIFINGTHTADAVTEDSIGGWVADGFRQQLERAGYQASVVDQLPFGCRRGIELQVQKIWTDADPGFWSVGAVSKVEFTMTVVRSGDKVEQVKLEGIGDDRSWIGTSAIRTKALSKALQSSVLLATRYAEAAWRAGQ